MNPTSSREEQLFFQALSLPTKDRAAWLERLAESDAVFRPSLEELLRAHEEGRSFLEALPAATLAREISASAPKEHAIGEMIGRYRLIEKLGEGGCGVVYIAEQREPVQRRVALKVIKLGMDTKAVIARFEAERQALALMDHPHIATVFDAGATSSGRPYFVMELVPGVSISHFCDQRKLSVKARLNLFTDVCHAIQHAHQKGVIHRDIKPANILVAQRDGQPIPKVIDFGVAKATQGRLAEQTVFTVFDQFIGTPAYMSPEQAGLGGLDVDIRSDIYSLGVLLCELLVGRPPFDPQALQRAPLDRVREIIRQTEPLRPSIQLKNLPVAERMAAAQSRGATVAELTRTLSGDLDRIVLCCLEKDRARRYASAGDLAADILRHLRHHPIAARSPSAGYVWRKFARRNRTALAIGSVAVAGLLGAVVVSVSQAVRAARAERLAAERLQHELSARQEAEQQKALAEERLSRTEKAEAQAKNEAATSQAVLDFLQNDILSQASPDHQGHRDLKLTVVLQSAAAKVETGFSGRPLVQASIHHTLSIIYRSLGDFVRSGHHLEKEIAIYERELPKDDRATLNARALLVAVYQALGKHQEAIALGLKTLEVQQRTVSPDQVDAYKTMTSLGLAYHANGALPEAEQALRNAVEGLTRLLGAEHPDTLVARNYFGRTYLHLERLSEAQQIFLELIPIANRVFGPEHPTTLTMRVHLGGSYMLLDQPADAEPIFRELLEAQRRVLGPEHAAVIETISALGTALRGSGKFVEAEAMYQEALAHRKRHYGEQHPVFAEYLSNIGGIRHDQGKFEEAEALQREAIAAQKSRLPNHYWVLECRLRLALVLVDEGKHAEAEALLLEVRDLCANTVGKEYPHYLESLDVLAELYFAQEKLAEAKELLTHSLTVRRKVQGDENMATLYCADELARVLAKEQRWSEAESLLRTTLALRGRARPKGSWHAAATQCRLGTVLLALGRHDEAQRLLEDAHAKLVAFANGIPARSKRVMDEAVMGLANVHKVTRKGEFAASEQAARD